MIALSNQAEVIFVATVEEAKSPNVKYRIEETLKGYKADTLVVTYTGPHEPAPGSKQILFLRKVSYGLFASSTEEPSRVMGATPERIEFVRKHLKR